jgi:hypothetical protein
MHKFIFLALFSYLSVSTVISEDFTDIPSIKYWYGADDFEITGQLVTEDSGNIYGNILLANASIFSSDQLRKYIELSPSAIIFYSARTLCCAGDRLKFFNMPEGISEMPIVIVHISDFVQMSRVLSQQNITVTVDSIDTVNEYYPSDTLLTIKNIISIVITIAFIIAVVWKTIVNAGKSRLLIFLCVMSITSACYRLFYVLVNPYHTTGLIESRLSIFFMFLIVPSTLPTTMSILLFYKELMSTRQVRNITFVKRYRGQLIIISSIYLIGSIAVAIAVCFVENMAMANLVNLLAIFITIGGILAIIVWSLITVISYYHTIYRGESDKHRYILATLITMIVFTIINYLVLLYCCALFYIFRIEGSAIFVQIISVVIFPLLMDSSYMFAGEIIYRVYGIETTTSSKRSD